MSYIDRDDYSPSDTPRPSPFLTLVCCIRVVRIAPGAKRRCRSHTAQTSRIALSQPGPRRLDVRPRRRRNSGSRPVRGCTAPIPATRGRRLAGRPVRLTARYTTSNKNGGKASNGINSREGAASLRH